jgi:hypothetical protein
MYFDYESVKTPTRDPDPRDHAGVVAWWRGGVVAEECQVGQSCSATRYSLDPRVKLSCRRRRAAERVLREQFPLDATEPFASARKPDQRQLR